MEKTTLDKLLRLQKVHDERVAKQQEEDKVAAELAASNERGVRTEMAKILGVTVEALRLRYGSVRQPEAAEG